MFKMILFAVAKVIKVANLMDLIKIQKLGLFKTNVYLMSQKAKIKVDFTKV